MSRSLDHLCYPMRCAAVELLARCVERKVPTVVLDTLRTPEEQEKFLREGKSKTLNSKHLPQKPSMLSAAMDAAPIKVFNIDVLKAIEWDQSARGWAVYGEEAERLGLVWGGRWGWDYSHVELP